MTSTDRLLTIDELAAYLSIPVATLYVWRHRRQGPSGFRVGRHVRCRSSDVERWIISRLDDEPLASVADDTAGRRP